MDVITISSSSEGEEEEGPESVSWLDLFGGLDFYFLSLL